jgi:hypothetical protein
MLTEQAGKKISAEVTGRVVFSLMTPAEGICQNERALLTRRRIRIPAPASIPQSQYQSINPNTIIALQREMSRPFNWP